MTPQFMGQPGDAEGKNEYEPDWIYGNIEYGEPWSIDFDNKVIFYTGDGSKASVNSLYSNAVEAFDADMGRLCMKQPIIAITPNSYVMQDGWQITEYSIKYLTGGSIEQNGDLYTSFCVMGAPPLGVASRLVVNNVTKTAEVMDDDQYEEMIKVCAGLTLTVSDKTDLVSFMTIVPQSGPIIMPNPLCQLSHLPKSRLQPYYDTDILGYPG